jgi:hypothetical protein
MATTHGHAKSPTYLSWSNMWQRTTDPNRVAFDKYSDHAPPIEWKNFPSFLKDMGLRPPGTSLERVDNSKGYSKANCVWATRKVQSNNKSDSVRVEYNGVSYTVKELAIFACVS